VSLECGGHAAALSNSKSESGGMAAALQIWHGNLGAASIMSDVAYVSIVRIERLGGPNRLAYLPAEKEPVRFGVHGAVAQHYKVDPAKVEPHATTLDYIVAATAG